MANPRRKPFDPRLEARDIDARVGANIRKYRERRRMTQRDLAKRLSITFQQVQKFEAGTNRVSAGRLLLIAEALQIPVMRFFEPKPSRRSGINEIGELSPEALRLAQALERVDDPHMKKAIQTILKGLDR